METFKYYFNYEKNKCIICGSKKISTDINNNLKVCKKCGFIWQYLIRDDNIYNEDYSVNYTMLPSYSILLYNRVFFIDAIRTSFKLKKEIIDIGCNTGDIIHILQKKLNYKIHGIEINKKILSFLNKPYISDDIIKIKNKYDMMTFFDSFEHIPNILNILKHIKQVIQPKIIIISLPDVKNYNIKNIKMWKHYKKDEHIYYFNIKTLSLLMNQFNYKLVNATYIEDLIRQGEKDNILTAIFKKN